MKPCRCYLDLWDELIEIGSNNSIHEKIHGGCGGYVNGNTHYVRRGMDWQDGFPDLIPYEEENLDEI